MRLGAGLVALALLVCAGSARAEPLRMVCRGIVTDSSSREQVRKGEPFEVLIDFDEMTVRLDGRPAVPATIRDDKISFSLPTAPLPTGKIRRLLSRGVSKLRPAPGPYELDRRSGFWRNRGASGLCSRPDAAQNLF